MSSPSEAAVAAREWVLHIPDYARAHAALGNALHLQSHVDQAAGAFPDYKRLALPLRETLRLKLDDAKGRDALVGQLNEAAWAWLHHGGNAYRTPSHAVSMAKEALELAPKAGDVWNTLATAQYRADDLLAAAAGAAVLRRRVPPVSPPRRCATYR